MTSLSKGRAKRRVVGGRLRSGINQEAVVFDGDRDLRDALLKNPTIAAIVEERRAAEQIGEARRELLLSSLKLTPRIAPELFHAVGRAREALLMVSKASKRRRKNPRSESD
jgi:hypothetical protein